MAWLCANRFYRSPVDNNDKQMIFTCERKGSVAMNAMSPKIYRAVNEAFI